MKGDLRIRAVVFESDGDWIAQCLEYDIATQAPTLDALLYELERILVAHLFVAEREKRVDPFADIPPAPRRFWEMYNRAQRPVRTVPRLPAPETQVLPELEVAFPSTAAA